MPGAVAAVRPRMTLKIAPADEIGLRKIVHRSSKINLVPKLETNDNIQGNGMQLSAARNASNLSLKIMTPSILINKNPPKEKHNQSTPKLPKIPSVSKSKSITDI